MKKKLIHSATIVNEGRQFQASVLIDGPYIEEIFTNCPTSHGNAESISGEGLYLLPGVIDDQVHFREPGLEYKADIFTESRAALAGGTTFARGFGQKV
jgi:dihydroorotase